jgi:hypothetical protein
MTSQSQPAERLKREKIESEAASENNNITANFTNATNAHTSHAKSSSEKEKKNETKEQTSKIQIIRLKNLSCVRTVSHESTIDCKFVMYALKYVF